MRHINGFEVCVIPGRPPDSLKAGISLSHYEAEEFWTLQMLAHFIDLKDTPCSGLSEFVDSQAKCATLSGEREARSENVTLQRYRSRGRC